MPVRQIIPNLVDESAGAAAAALRTGEILSNAVTQVGNQWEESRKRDGHVQRMFKGVQDTLTNAENLQEWGWDQATAQQEVQRLAPMKDEPPEEYDKRVITRMKELEQRGVSFQRLMSDTKAGGLDTEQVRQEALRRGMGADPRVQSYLDEGVRANVLAQFTSGRVAPAPTPIEEEAGLGELSALLSKIPPNADSKPASPEPSAQFQTIGAPKQTALSSIPMDVQQGADSDLLEQLRLGAIGPKEFYKEQAALNKAKRDYENSLSLEERMARNRLALQDDSQEFTAGESTKSQEFTAAENAMNRASDERRTRMSTEPSRAAAGARARAAETPGEKNLTELLKQRLQVIANETLDLDEETKKRMVAEYDEIIEKQRMVEGVGESPVEWATARAGEIEEKYPKVSKLSGSYSPLLDETRRREVALEVAKIAGRAGVATDHAKIMARLETHSLQAILTSIRQMQMQLNQQR